MQKSAIVTFSTGRPVPDLRDLLRLHLHPHPHELRQVPGRCFPGNFNQERAISRHHQTLHAIFPFLYKKVSSLPYRTVTNAFGATFVLWVIISSAAVPIWFAHHLMPKGGAPKETAAATAESPRSTTPSSPSKLLASQQTGDSSAMEEEEEAEFQPYLGTPPPSYSPGNTTLAPDPSEDEDAMLLLQQQHWCRFSEEEYSHSAFSVAFFVSGYAIPLLLIVIMYIYMLRRLWHPVGHHQVDAHMLPAKLEIQKFTITLFSLDLPRVPPQQEACDQAGAGGYHRLRRVLDANTDGAPPQGSQGIRREKQETNTVLINN